MSDFEDIYELSPVQQAMLVHVLYAPDSDAFINQIGFTLDGPLDPATVQSALAQLIGRHTALRTSVLYQDLDRPYQVVHPAVEPPVTFLDWSELTRDERSARLDAWLTEDRARGFDISEAPLLRVAMIAQGKDRHYLIWSFHHIILEGLSFSIILGEFWKLLKSAPDISVADWPPAQPYSNYIRWLQGRDRAKAEQYWRQALGGLTSATHLPIDSAAAGERSSGLNERFEKLVLDQATAAELYGMARRHRLTLNTIMHGIWAILLSRYTGESDVVFGTAVSARPVEMEEAQSMVGLFVNALPARIAVNNDDHVVSWLQGIQTGQAEMRQYDFSSMLDIQRWSEVPGGQPIFESLLIFENWYSDPSAMDLGEQFRVEDVFWRKGSDLPLTVDVYAGDNSLELVVFYDTERFEAATVKRLCGHLETLIEGVISGQEGGLVGDLPLLGEQERDRILHQWNETAREWPRDRCLHQLIETQVAETPDAVAVSDDTESLSYAELDTRADGLARYLQQQGVRSGELVGIAIERGVDLVVGLLGILKAGAAYLPLDTTHPRGRLAYILEDAGVRMVVTMPHLLAGLPAHEISILLEETSLGEAASGALSPLDITPDSRAYGIYTSGSTGLPKGVQVPHRAVVNFLNSMAGKPGMTRQDVMLAVTTVSFDIHVLELFLPLTVGARVHVASHEATSDGVKLLSLLRKQGVSVMQATPATWRMLLEAGWSEPLPIRVLCGGEPLPMSLAKRLLGCCDELWNMYGPTETTVWSSIYRVEPAADAILVGRPIDNTRFYILDRSMQPVPAGAVGELYIGGEGVTDGYIGRPELTSERFVADPFMPGRPEKLYRTGDLARYLPAGEVQLLGRIDHQVKLRGFRIELGEIESVLESHPEVSAAAVVVYQEDEDDPRLVAYGVSGADSRPTNTTLREFLGDHLPQYMIPSLFVWLDSLPLNPSGKIDRKALPAPESSNQSSAAYMAPRSDLERRVAEVWRAVLNLEQVGISDNFFDLGGHSLLMARLQSRLREELGQEVTMVDLFRYPSIGAFVRHLDGAEPQVTLVDQVRDRAARRTQEGADDHSVAIVGMAGRFPGSDSVAAFWKNLAGGVESIRFFTPEELIAAGIPAAALDAPNYVPARGYLDDAELFDAAFFGYSPREAEFIDPQQRLFLESAWEALEVAGYDADRYPGHIGVFAGASFNTYLLRIASQPGWRLESAGIQGMISNDKDFLPTRVSYKLNLRGPSVNVQTACSTSLVAVHEACRSLWNHECDMALAGGVSVTSPRMQGYVHLEQGILSPDGHCRAFSADADGTVGGEGVGTVVLKRLADAIAEGDTIWAVIKASAINNDGSNKVGYTAPSIEGQAEVIAMAQVAAGIDPASIDYIETHGTGTALGDPIEVAALTQVMKDSDAPAGSCALGAVKTNIGHLDAAAGVAGLIKTTLALRHGQIPPSLNFTAPNPKIDFDQGPFFVNTALKEWPATPDRPRRAAVSSFGIGGTNAHVILEEAPALPESAAAAGEQLLLLSARTPSALQNMARNLAGHLREDPGLHFADVAYTLATGRKMMAERCVLVASDALDAAEALEAMDPSRLRFGSGDPVARDVVFMFSGQGAQYPGMARGLYERYGIFKDEVDHCCDLLHAHLGFDLRELLYPQDARSEQAAAKLTRTANAQPALFVVEYALARLWMSYGVQPTAMIGHSIGEYVAACLAGVMSLEDALKLVACRGQLMQAQPAGAMLSVALSSEELAPLIADPLCIAAINAPAATVVSGPVDAIDSLEQRLAEQGQSCRRLHTSHAFHSAMMEPAAAALCRHAADVSLHPPVIPFLSNYTGTWISEAEATSTEYWGKHLRHPVQFAAGLGVLLEQDNRCFIEVGPGNALATFVKQHTDFTPRQLVVNSIGHPNQDSQDAALFLEAAGRVWLGGNQLAWYGGDTDARHRVPLPTYPFERERFWIEPDQSVATTVVDASAMQKSSDIADWFHVPSWRRGPGPSAVAHDAARQVEGCWLLFADESGIGTRLQSRLVAEGATVYTVGRGSGFEQDASNGFTIDASRTEHYLAVLKAMREAGHAPDHVVHLWGIGTDENTDRLLDRCFYSLLYITQALGSEGNDAPVQIHTVADGVLVVTGGEQIIPEKASILGPCATIPQEYAHISCRFVDLASDRTDDPAALVDNLLVEFANPAAESAVAYRGAYRWTQAWEALRLEQADAPPKRLRTGGVYLITGGLGGIGLVLAEYLARAFSARLVLLGRTVLPDRQQWDDWLQSHAPDDPVSRKINAIRMLESAGAEVMYGSADVLDAAQMRDTVADACARFGAIHGVIHAAGMPGGGLIALKTRADAASVLAPKVQGTRILEQALANCELDFMFLFSSVTAVIGDPGQVDYMAANTFLDAFAHARSASGKYTVAVNWDAWRDVGMAVNTDVPEALRDKRLQELQHAIGNDEGIEAFQRVLRCDVPQLAVVTRIGVMRRGWMAMAGDRAVEATEVEETGAVPTQHARPQGLGSAYVAPTSETEQAIAAIWQDLLGIEQVGIHDNFFDLGGHSLLFPQMQLRLQESLDRKTAVLELFEHPSIAELARFLTKGEAMPRSAEASSERASRRAAGARRIQQQRSRRSQS